MKYFVLGFVSMLLLVAVAALAANPKKTYPDTDRTFGWYDGDYVKCYPIMAMVLSLAQRGYEKVGDIKFLVPANRPDDVRPMFLKKSGDNISVYRRKDTDIYLATYNAVRLKSGHAFMSCVVAGGVMPELTLDF